MEPIFKPQLVTRPNQILHSPGGQATGNHGHIIQPSFPVPVVTATEHTGPTLPSTPDKFVSHAHFEMEIKEPNMVEQNHKSPVHQPSPVMGAGLHEQWPRPLVAMNNVDQLMGEEDLAYTQALLMHQKARMEKLRSDLQQSNLTLSALRLEVGQLENGRQETVRSSSFATGDDIQNMRESNRKLQVDVQMLAREIDIFNNGQTPLGVVNVNTDQHFYENIFNGQQGPLYQSKATKKPTGHPPLPPKKPPAPAPPTPPARPPRQPDREEGDNWNCSACTFLNHPALDKCECCEMPRISPKNVT